MDAIKHGIDAGYRHFDTAFIYGNEQQVGQAVREKIAEGVVKREDLFIVTKVIKYSQFKRYRYRFFSDHTHYISL